MAPFLPSDCLREIFEHMRDISGQIEDRKSLLSCLLINRLWCETAVEILWRNPWRLGCFYTDEIYWESLSTTVSSCLSKKQKESIKKNVINLQLSITERQPTFNYISYIQCLSNEHIKKVVKTLADENSSLPTVSWHYNANIIENELWKLFMSKCTSVKYLELPNTSIYHFLDSNRCLTTLTEFECSTYSPSKLFLDLAQVCRNIKKMTINPCGDDNEGLEALISLQNNLQEVKLVSIQGGECQRIGKALETQLKSLTSVTFEFSICIPVSTLCNLSNLKTLKILVKDIDSDLEDLVCAELPKLEILEIMNSAYQPLDLYTSLIQTTCGCLRKINFRTIPHPSEGEIQPYIQSIIVHCPNIEDVTLWYIEEVYDELDELLSSCKNIKSISLEALSTFSNLEEWDVDDDDDDLDDLDLDFTLSCDAASIFDLFLKGYPRNLVQLSLSGSWRFTDSELETFLKSWEGRNPLFLSLACEFEMGEEYFDVLDNCKSNGILKGWSDCSSLDSD